MCHFVDRRSEADGFERAGGTAFRAGLCRRSVMSPARRRVPGPGGGEPNGKPGRDIPAESSQVEDWPRPGARRHSVPDRYPWLSAARGIRCGWCDRGLADCLCFQCSRVRSIAIAAFLASLPRWCRTCRGLLPCRCDKRKVYTQNYRDRRKVAGGCASCMGPSPDIGRVRILPGTEPGVPEGAPGAAQGGRAVRSVR